MPSSEASESSSLLTRRSWMGEFRWCGAEGVSLRFLVWVWDVTESLLGDTERREEVVVLGLSRRWKEEEDSLRLRERSRVRPRLVLRRSRLFSCFDSRPRGFVGPLPGGDSKLLLVMGFESLALVVEEVEGAEAGAAVKEVVRGVEGRG